MLAVLLLEKGQKLCSIPQIMPKIMLAQSARAYVQNVRDFPQTKLDSEINAPFLLNEHGDPRLFFRYLLRTVIKNIFEKEKKFDSRT